MSEPVIRDEEKKLRNTSQTPTELEMISSDAPVSNSEMLEDESHEESSTESTSSSTMRIVSIQEEYLPQVRDVLKEAFATKRCMLCLPVDETMNELQQRYTEMPEAKWKLGAVALDSKGRVLGYTQMTTAGLPIYPEDFHTCAEDELYIEIVAVSPEARGQGIGTMLLEWCHEIAISEYPYIARLQLEVLRGNRAIRLYERLGFEIKPLQMGCFYASSAAILICCFFGRPYGLCNREWGSVEMEMILERGEQVNIN
jgi:ribosomal protein S18 acetylase RimI-like enzyme